MSRAFIKESDDVQDLPDRPVSPHPNLVTEHGVELIEAELARFRAALAEAQGKGDRAATASALRELRYWTSRRATAEMQPPATDNHTVRFGSRVTIERGRHGKASRTQTFRIVGEDEADPTAGSLSHASPLARALIGRSVGEVVAAGQDEAEVIGITTD